MISQPFKGGIQMRGPEDRPEELPDDQPCDYVIVEQSDFTDAKRRARIESVVRARQHPPKEILWLHGNVEFAKPA